MMSSLYLVDPELRPWLAANPMPLVSRDNLQQLRQRKLVAPDEAALALPVDVGETTVPGPADAPDVGILLLRPRGASADRPAILHMHGGGFIRGAARESESALRRLSAQLQCVVVSVDYRLAPEAPFPAAIEDCYAALSWLFRNAAELGVDPARVGVMGESAGAGLAACLALLARDRGEWPLAFQQLHYPALDDRSCLRAPPPFTGEFVWGIENHLFAWRCLLGGEPGGEAVSPYAAAARAEDLSGLPPSFIGAGALDLLAKENIDFARRLMDAGVPTELHIIPGAFHGFDRVAPSRIGSLYRQLSVDALRRLLSSGVAPCRDPD